jgi:hypothetical protein
MRDSAPPISVITAPGNPMHVVQLVKENPNKNKQNCCWGELLHYYYYYHYLLYYYYYYYYYYY